MSFMTRFVPAFHEYAGTMAYPALHTPFTDHLPHLSSSGPRIERVTQSIAKEREGHHHEGNC
jgi:hypothetical protein